MHTYSRVLTNLLQNNYRTSCIWLVPNDNKSLRKPKSKHGLVAQFRITAHTNLGSFSKDAWRPSLPLGFASKVIPGSSSSLLGMGPTVASIDGDDLPS